MKFSCEKLLLLTAALTAARATTLRSPVPLLEGLLIDTDDESIRISGYDLKTGIITTVPATVEEKGCIVLNAKIFVEIIRRAPGHDITINSDSRHVTSISCENSEFEIMGSPDSDYPELPVVEGEEHIEIIESKLNRMIAQTNFAVSNNEARPIYTGALFETSQDELTIVALDGFRLAMCTEKISGNEGGNLSFVVPGIALSEVERVTTDGDKNVYVTLGPKHIQFVIGDITIISRRLEGEFLNYRASIPQSLEYQFIFDKDDLIASLERVSLILSEKVRGPVKCVFGDGSVKLSTSSEYGKASDECAANGSCDDIEIGFNDRYLLETLKTVPASTIKFEFTNGITPSLITAAEDESDFLYMILPVRLKAYDS